MNNKIDNEGNIRLILLVVFSFTFLSLWNIFVIKPDTVKNKEVARSENVEVINDRSSRHEVVKEENIAIKDFKFDGKYFFLSGNINKDGRIVISGLSSKKPKMNNLIQNKDEIVFDFNSSVDRKKMNVLVNENDGKLNIIVKNNNIEIKRTIFVAGNSVIEIKSYFKNKSNSDIKVIPYFYFKVSQNYFDEAISGSKDSIKRISLSDLKKKPEIESSEWIAIHAKNFSISVDSSQDENAKFIVTPSDFEKNNYRFGKFNNEVILEKNQIKTTESRLFLLPNEKDILKSYSEKYSLPNLEKIVNFGAFFFIVEPILYLMNIIYKVVGNYAMAIILLTILFKAATIPLLNRSYVGMAKMKGLNPQIEKIKEKYKDDKVLMQKEIMNLYKANNINPLTSMIPMLIQLPFFFAFYKVFSIAFELHGATGFLWINDLSETEGNLLFSNLQQIPSILRIGPMAILMGLTTWLQQKTSPMSGSQSGDESQALAMKFMPIFFVFLSSSFPSGLLIYWITGNIFSILHQLIYNKLQK